MSAIVPSSRRTFEALGNKKPKGLVEVLEQQLGRLGKTKTEVALPSEAGKT